MDDPKVGSWPQSVQLFPTGGRTFLAVPLCTAALPLALRKVLRDEPLARQEERREQNRTAEGKVGSGGMHT